LLKAVGKTHAIAVPRIRRGLDDHADRPARMNDSAVGSADFDLSDDLSADGEDEMGVGG
jgi:hypothetical protein